VASNFDGAALNKSPVLALQGDNISHRPERDEIELRLQIELDGTRFKKRVT
jgi:hypothetical protein